MSYEKCFPDSAGYLMKIYGTDDTDEPVSIVINGHELIYDPDTIPALCLALLRAIGAEAPQLNVDFTAALITEGHRTEQGCLDTAAIALAAVVQSKENTK